MKPSPAFQFYPHDFLVGTADLTAEEVGGYIRLLCYQWAKGSLPNDEKKLSQLSGISDGLSLGNVSVKFRLCEDGFKRNHRLETVRLEQEEYRKKQAENGSKGGNPNFKHGKHNPYYKPKDNPLDNPKINSSSSSSPSSSPISSEYIGMCKEIISYLNEKAGTSFRNVKSNDDFIIARLKEGATLDDLRAVIDLKCKDWIGKPESKYLRPETLFNATKFNSYVGLSSVKQGEKKWI